jgi:hypothetical protein
MSAFGVRADIGMNPTAPSAMADTSHRMDHSNRRALTDGCAFGRLDKV